MPQVLRVATVNTHEKKRKRSQRENLSVTRPLFSNSRGVVCKVLFTLWSRLMDSYASFHKDGSSPFLIEDHMSWDALMVHFALPSGKSNIYFLSDNDKWQSMFGSTVTLEAMIYCLYQANADVDAVAWLVAFCIVDKLQLLHCIDQQKNINSCMAAERNSAPFFFYSGHMWRNMFTAYCLALKWHVDFYVTSSYLISLLPYSSHDSQYFSKMYLLTEKMIFCRLNYNISVRPGQVLELLDHFLTPHERGFIIEAMNTKSVAA